MDTAQIALAVAAALLLLGAGAALGALLAQRRLRRGHAAAADSPPQDLAWPRAAYVAIVGVVSCALALGGAALYGRLGGSTAPDALKGPMFRADRPPAIVPGGAPVAGDLNPLLERLAAKLKAAPDDPRAGRCSRGAMWRSAAMPRRCPRFAWSSPRADPMRSCWPTSRIRSP